MRVRISGPGWSVAGELTASGLRRTAVCDEKKGPFAMRWLASARGGRARTYLVAMLRPARRTKVR